MHFLGKLRQGIKFTTIPFILHLLHSTGAVLQDIRSMAAHKFEVANSGHCHHDSSVFHDFRLPDSRDHGGLSLVPSMNG